MYCACAAETFVVRVAGLNSTATTTAAVEMARRAEQPRGAIPLEAAHLMSCVGQWAIRRFVAVLTRAAKR